jgi:hypothetical protein
MKLLSKQLKTSVKVDCNLSEIRNEHVFSNSVKCFRYMKLVGAFGQGIRNAAQKCFKYRTHNLRVNS